MNRELDFEKPLLELDRRIAELRQISQGLGTLAHAPDASGSAGAGLGFELARLESTAKTLRSEVFDGLTRWQVVQLSRHANRPYALDYIRLLVTDFVELHGDRAFGDDGAIVCGVGRFEGDPVMIIGQQKGRTTKQNLQRNFGMPRPEGYRKAMRVMAMAERFGLPVITLIDTPGAYPGVDAEERGQAQAIAESLELMASLGVPIISTVIGEGGSGGALAIGLANRVLMFEYATYSVISPEACSSILFRDAEHAEPAADALRLTARDLRPLGIVDEVIAEPEGGAHRDMDEAAEHLRGALKRSLSELAHASPDELRDGRYERFRKLGAMADLPTSAS